MLITKKELEIVGELGKIWLTIFDMGCGLPHPLYCIWTQFVIVIIVFL